MKLQYCQYVAVCVYQKPTTVKLDPKISIGARKPNYCESNMYMRHTLEKDKMASGSEEEIIQKKKKLRRKRATQTDCLPGRNCLS